MGSYMHRYANNPIRCYRRMGQTCAERNAHVKQAKGQAIREAVQVRRVLFTTVGITSA